jgi:hypothetical protein
MHVLSTSDSFGGWTDDHICDMFRMRKALEVLKTYFNIKIYV